MVCLSVLHFQLISFLYAVQKYCTEVIKVSYHVIKGQITDCHLSDEIQNFHQQHTGQAECVSVPSPKCFKKNVLSCEHTCGNTHKHTLKHTQTRKFQVSVPEVCYQNQASCKLTGP